MALDKDWLTSQLTNELSLQQKFGESAEISTVIPPSGSYTFTITVAAATLGDPVAVSPDKTLGADVGMYSRSVAGGVEVKLRNFNATLSATLTAVIFRAAIFQEVD